MKTILPVLAVLTTTGCASTLSTLQTASTVPPRHVQVTGGYGLYLPMGPAVSAVAQGVKQAKNAIEAAKEQEKFELSEEDKQALLTAGIGLAAMPPGIAYSIQVRTGILNNWDVGLQYSTSGSLKADTKLRFFHKGPAEGEGGVMTPSYDAAIGLAGSKYFFQSPVIQVLDYVQLGDFSRWDVEVPAYFSIEWGQILKFWVAPKYLYSNTSFDEELVGISEGATQLSGYDLTLPSTVHTHFAGASVGFGAGYKWVHLMLELTAGYTWCRPTVLGQKRELGGVTLYPAVGLQFRI